MITKARALNTFISMADDTVNGHSICIIWFRRKYEITLEISSILSKFEVHHPTVLKRQEAEDKVRYAYQMDIGASCAANCILSMRMTLFRSQMQLYDSTRCGLVTIMSKKPLHLFTPSLPLVTDCGWKIGDRILVTTNYHDGYVLHITVVYKHHHNTIRLTIQHHDQAALTTCVYR